MVSPWGGSQARYITNPDGLSCEFAIVVDDEWQRAGLGRYLMTQLIEVARATDGTFLLGASLGASHLLELAWQRPDAFAGLALQSGAFLGTPDRPDPYRSTRSWVLERLAAEGLRLPWR